MTHPFIAQHDPDFTEDGYITVFDNHTMELTPKSKNGGSRILRVEPSTNEISVIYGWKEDQYFFTPWCGKHQHLPNGNILITESVPGRVFEINANGKVVWNWIMPRWNKKYISSIQEGTRYSWEFTAFVDRKKGE